MILPRYPIYIPSKGRHDVGLTAPFLIREHVPFKLVIEPQEAKQYASRFGEDRLLILPFSNLGQGSIPARNWIKDHATTAGFTRHWQLDDNMGRVYRRYKRTRIPCALGPAFAAIEDFVDRYENIALAGMNYSMFMPDLSTDPPFYLNSWVYSCTLALNSLPYRWRGRYNEDTDLCLQVLSGNWCTIRVNTFLIQKQRTMTVKGGNTSELYKGDGRLKMARALERMWPGVVKVTRRFQRPQHIVNWAKFDTPLKLKSAIQIDSTPNEYGLKLAQIAEIKSKTLQKWLRNNQVEVDFSHAWELQ